MVRHFSVTQDLKRAAFALLLLGGLASGGAQPAAAQTGQLVGLSKKVCAVSDLPANPTPGQIGNCSSSSAGIGETVYYVLTVINTSFDTQDITLTDTFPADFVPIPGAQCAGSSLALSSSPASGSTATVITATGPLPAGQSATCTIPGYFTNDGRPVNTAGFSARGQQTGQITEGSDSAPITIDPAIPLPGNLSIVKTADKTVESLTDNGGSVTVTYTITVKNTGAGDLYTGGYLQVVDNLAALPSSGIGFSFDVDFVNCDPSAGTPLCPTQINGSSSGNTTNQSNGVVLGVWEYNPGEDGLIPAGESFTITYVVTYRGPEGCIYPGALNGVQNTAYIRFASGQSAPSPMAFSDMDVDDNTSSVDLQITDHEIVDLCPTPAPDELTVTKVQKSPASGTIAWGTPVVYYITVSNPPGIGPNGPPVPAGPTVTNIAVTDLLALLPGMPNVAVTTANVECITDPTNCIVPPATVPSAPFTSFTTTLNQLSVQVPVANVTVLSLADGDSEVISVTLSFKPLSCVSYVGDGLRQTANFGRIDYEIQTPIKNGFITSQHTGMSAPVITDHDKVPECTLKVEKEGPSEIIFGQPFGYVVTYENFGPDPIDIGTLLDAMAINVPDYAASLSGIYNYACTVNPPGIFPNPPGTFPANLHPAIQTSPTFTVGHNSIAAQGTRLLQTLAPNLPVTLPGNTTLTCGFEITLNQPAADNPYCMSKGSPRLVNSALMDVSHYFNTNLPVPPQAFATTQADLPLCQDVSVKKIISPSIVAPGGTAIVTLEFHSHGDQGSPAGATIQDTLKPGMVYVPYSLQCSNCVGPLVEPASTGTQTISATFGNIPPNGKETVTFKVTMTGPAPRIVDNIVTGIYDPAGNWYDQTVYDTNGNISDSDIIGVFELFPVTITKEIVNMSPGQPPNGLFTFNANCSYTYQQGTTQPNTFTFSGTANVTLPSATATFMSSAGVPMMVPVGATCTFTETGLPSGTGGFGFSAVGYSPAAPSGAAGQITVVAGPNEGLVENCYGPAAANPLSVAHTVGKECPAVPVVTEITKTCDPAIPGPNGRPLFAHCTVQVTTTGQFPAGLTVSENFNGSSGDITLNGTSPAALQWSCDPSPTAAPGPHVCTFTGGTQANPGPNTATFDYTVSFADANEAQSSKNCAVVADRNGVLGEYCTGFEVKDTPSWPDLKIDKVCKDPEQRRYAIGAAATGLAWFSDCEITVNASGPLPGPITVTDTLGSSPNGGAMIQTLTAAGWSCAPMPTGFAPVPGPVTCTLAGPFPSNGPWVISATVLLPLGETFAKNCVELAALGDPIAESCVGIEVPVEDSRLQIKKVVVSNAPGSVAGLSFPVMVGCSNSPGSFGLDNLQDGETKPFWGYIPNTTCTVSEGTMPATDACGPGMVPKWTESYAPSNIVTLSPSGTQVSITNTLDCEPDRQGWLLIRKSLDTSAAPGANVASLTFPVSLNCGGAVQTGTISLSAPWSPVGLSTTTPCTVAENVAALPVAGVCPAGQTANWGVSYVPANASVTPTVAGATMVVVNKLTCTQNPPLRKISVKKVVVNNAPGSVAGLMFPITVACGPNTPSVHSPKTVGHQNGQTNPFVGAQGDTCTISEGAYPATTACGKSMVPVWSKTIVPSTLTVGATNAQVLVTNTLNCKKNWSWGGGNVSVIDILPNPIAFPLFTLTKTCQPAVPVAGATFAQAICTITVTQTAGAPVDKIVVTETLTSGANGAQITSLTGPGWSFPALPVAANIPVTMQLPGAALTGTPRQSTITAVVQLPNAAAATGGQNCVSVQGFDPAGLEMASAGPFCAPLVNGSATIVPTGSGPALDLTHTSAGPCRDDREKQTYTCLFSLDVTNPSDVEFLGPEVISQTFGEIRPLEVSGKGEGWACTPARQNATCVNGELSLLPGGQTTVEMRFLLPAQRDGGQFTTCARLGIPEDDATRVLLAQQAAQAFGLDVGRPDGVMGPRTKAAVAQMQERLNLTVNGEPDNALFSALGLRLDKGVAPQCVTVDLPPMAAPKCRKGDAFVEGAGCQPIRQPEPKAEPRKPVEKTPDPVEKPLQCDPATTVLRDGECNCRREGTVKLTETTCG